MRGRGSVSSLARLRLRNRRDHLRRRRLRDSLIMTTIYRAEVIGAILRPAWLKQARTDFAADRISTAQFKRDEDRAVDEAIALQERCAVDVVSDGEMRRSGFVAPLTDYVEGFEAVAFDTRRWQGGGGGRSGETSLAVPLTVTGKLRRRRSLAAEEFIIRARPRDASAEGDAAESVDARDALVAGTFGGGLSRSVRALRRRRRYPARRSRRPGEPRMRIYPDRRAGTGYPDRPVNARARLRGAWHLDRADAGRGRRDAQPARVCVPRHVRVPSLPRHHHRPLPDP